MEGHDAEVRRAAYDPQGAYIASGSYDKTVRLWHGETGEYERTLAQQPRNVVSLAFDAGGSRLVTTTGRGSGSRNATVWRVSDGEPLTRFSKHTNTVFSAAFSPDGATVASTGGGNNDIYLWDAETGEVRQHIVGVGAAAWSVGWQADGMSIALGRASLYLAPNDQGPLETVFSPLGLTLEDIEETSAYTRAQATRRGLGLRVESDGALLVRKGDAIEATIHPSHLATGIIRCFSFTPSGSVVLGSSFSLGLYDAVSGQSLREFRRHTGEIWAVACSPDGRFLASGSGDQTVRIWSLDDDADTVAPLLSLFVADDAEWVCWTEKGYYACSPNGDRFVGWHINQGRENAAKFAMAYQFKRQLWRPDIVSRVLETGDVDEAERLANEERGAAPISSIEVATLAEHLPPVIFIALPLEPATTVTQGTLRVQAHVRRVGGSETTSAHIHLNGHPLPDGLGRMPVGGGDASEIVLDEEVTLTEGENTIAVIASNAYANSETRTRTVTYEAASTPHAGPNLYVLAVGVKAYKDGNVWPLGYCDADARDFVAECERQKGGFYRDVTTRVLTDEQATRGDVMDALKWVVSQAVQGDVVFVFLAAHGAKDRAGDVHLVCHDTDPDDLLQGGVPWTAFRTSFHGMPFRTVMFVDTCYSGGHAARGTDGPRKYGADRDFTQAYEELSSPDGGVVVFASSTRDEESLEDVAWENGAFTEALLEGMKGAADILPQDGEITDTELASFVAERVKDLTGGEQHAVWRRPETMPEMTLLGAPPPE